MSITNKNVDLEVRSFVSTGVSEAIVMQRYEGFAFQASFNVTPPTAKAFASATDLNLSTDTITEVGHGYITGLVGQFTTSGTLPTGITAATDYYIILVDDDSYQIATSLANALIGTQVDITGLGTGNQTFTPNALAGGFIELQTSVKAKPLVDADWAAIPDSNIAITAAGTQDYNVSKQQAAWFRYQITITAGQIIVTSTFNAKRG